MGIFIFLIIVVVAIVVFRSHTKKKQQEMERKIEEGFVSRFEQGETHVAFELVNFYFEKQKADQAEALIEKLIAQDMENEQMREALIQSSIQLCDLLITMKRLGHAKEWINKMRDRGMVEEAILGKLNEKREASVLKDGSVHDRVQMLIEKGGTPSQIKIDEFEWKSGIRDSGQYEIVKELIFNLVKKGFKCRNVSTYNSGGGRYSGMVFFDGGRIEFCNGPSTGLTAASFHYGARSDHVSKNWVIFFGNFLVIDIKDDSPPPEPPEFIVVCADAIRSCSYEFKDPEWYDGYKHIYPSSAVVKMHEYIKRGR